MRWGLQKQRPNMRVEYVKNIKFEINWIGLRAGLYGYRLIPIGQIVFQIFCFFNLILAIMETGAFIESTD